MAMTPKRSARASAVSTPHSAMPNTGRAGALAADMQAGVGEAGDDEGVGFVVRLDQPPERQRDALDVLLVSMP